MNTVSREKISTDELSVADLEQLAIEAVEHGVRLIKDWPERPRTLRTKSSPTDPVTALDLEVERSIKSLISGRTPDA